MNALLLFILTMFTGLCVAHVIGRILPRKPGSQASRLERAVEPRQVRAEIAYDNLLNFDEEFTGWKVQRYTNEEYKRMRAER